MSPSPYVKKGYGAVSKEAEDRIRDEIIVKCKVCGGIMTFHRAKTGNYYHCIVCLRNVVITQL